MPYEMRARVYKQGADNPARRYLQEYPAMYDRHAALLRELARLRECTTRATGRMDALRLSGTPNHGGNEDAMLRVVEAEDVLTDLIGRMAAALSARLRLIESLPDEMHKTLLTLRYINGLNWEQVGYKLHYERTQLFELHGRALKAAQEAMARQAVE